MESEGQQMIFRVSLLVAVVASLALTPFAFHKHANIAATVAETTGSAPDSPASAANFYSFRLDFRKCASPRCGGYFVKLVNERRTRCADKRFANECYVASIDWDGQTEPDNDRALLRGTMQTKGDRNGRFGTLVVTEVWQAASANQATGMFFRVRDRRIRCIAAPCPTHQEARLNSSISRNIAGVDLSGAGASDSLLSDANAAMTSTNGIIISGDHSPVTGPAGRSQMLKATQFYLRAGNSASLKPCMKTGCSGQICADHEVISTCEYSSEYACYKKATCERQANGDCGFTQTPELKSCLILNRKSGD
jgi:hypothetical protein